MRHLCSEAIYGTVIGPAIDCHCIRWCVEFGIVHSAMNVETMSRFIKKTYNLNQIKDINDIPASLSQLFSKIPKRQEEFTKLLLDCAIVHALGYQLLGFLWHYVRGN
jgi:hypothetical protein